MKFDLIIKKLGITPGPWEASTARVIERDCISVNEEAQKNKITAICGDIKAEDENESIANAFLIAAAPEMFERDIDFLNGLEKLKEVYSSFMREREVYIIDKVIKMFDFAPDQKATGKSWERIKELMK